MNTNCLEGFKCPECGHEDDFNIEIVVRMVVRMTDDGYDDSPYADSEWDDDSFCECCECSKVGTVKDFRISNSETAGS